MPDYWLVNGNPWEIERLDVQYLVRFYGNVVATPLADGSKKVRQGLSRGWSSQYKHAQGKAGR